MKKIKIMLLTLAFFAVLGATLAFNAKFTTSYCTTYTIPDGQGGWTCPVLIEFCPELQNSTTLKGIGISAIICTTYKPPSGCNEVTDCYYSTPLYRDIE